MHQQLIPGLSKHVQSFHLAWLTRRIGIKSLVQFQEMLARGLALSLSSYGAAFDLMEALLYLIWYGLHSTSYGGLLQAISSWYASS